MRGIAARNSIFTAERADIEVMAQTTPHVPAPKTPEAARVRELVRQALRSRETIDAAFELVRQPIVELATGRVSHHELLLRMRDDQGDLIKPGEFVSSIRDLGADEQIDNWVTARAVMMLVPTIPDWGPQLEINLSARTVLSSGFFEQLTSVLNRRKVDPDSLIIEVAEGDAVDPEKMRHFMRRRFRLAHHFSLIDFESHGFESLNRLRSAPYDMVKIDGEFIRDLPNSPSDQGIVTKVARMVGGQGRRTVALHVGDAETVSLLKEAGVDYGQGYYLGQPESLRGRSARDGRPATVAAEQALA
jgi:EAL domain-containing protein (putative c-di-GMP-specific phosphodiesterase class I)